MTPIQPLSPSQLFRHCDPTLFQFETTAELEDLDEVLGQPRAVEAIRFGIGILQKGYNVFAFGPPGTGKESIVRKFFRDQAESEAAPEDLCYVHNFDQNHRPRAIMLPAGRGRDFCKAMDRLVEELLSALAAAFESDEYRTQRQIIEDEFKDRQEQAFASLQKQALEHELMLLRTPTGLIFAPSRAGQVMPPEEFQKLEQAEREKIEADIEKLQKALEEALQAMPSWQRELRERLRVLSQEMTTHAVGGLIGDVRARFEEFPDVLAHLDRVQEDVVRNAVSFLQAAEGGPPSESEDQESSPGPAPSPRSHLRRYKVNLLVDHADHRNAPVIFEDNPTYQNLIGRVEQIARMGALLTDFTLIKPGSLLEANGGYLILEARKVLTHPYAWEGLKRALQAEEVRIESPVQMLNLISTITIEPEPVPLRVKVALLGDPFLYHTLSQLDPDFSELFKVGADFSERMDRDEESLDRYARLLATIGRQCDLRPIHRDAVARVVEHSGRLIGDSEKLSMMMNAMNDLLREADYWAGEEGVDVIRAAHVQRAVDAQIFRANRIQERMQESILRETVLIDTEGEKVGQINGLSVLQLGSYAFGKPSRITARVRLGKGEVIDIEREVALSGPLHAKGVLILSSFLGARYAADAPLSLSASLVFEQSYSGVEGDSASSAELYALLSALAGLPIKQPLAVTGSVNQHGQVQAIGGVNEKIEGFFDLCQARGLTGDQGVLIPSANVKHLMLKDLVIEAVEAGQFHIYPVETIDQGIELLTGVPAGEPDPDGVYPEGSVNGLVQQELGLLAQKRQSLLRGEWEL